MKRLLSAILLQTLLLLSYSPQIVAQVLEIKKPTEVVSNNMQPNVSRLAFRINTIKAELVKNATKLSTVSFSDDQIVILFKDSTSKTVPAAKLSTWLGGNSQVLSQIVNATIVSAQSEPQKHDVVPYLDADDFATIFTNNGFATVTSINGSLYRQQTRIVA